jgi:hypothetical protein
LIWSIDDDTGSGQGYGIKDFSFSAAATNTATLFAPTQPLLGNAVYTHGSGLTFGFSNISGAASAFRVWETTNVALPFKQWTSLGNPTEVSPGNYQFTDPESATNAPRFYTVTSP